MKKNILDQLAVWVGKVPPGVLATAASRTEQILLWWLPQGTWERLKFLPQLPGWGPGLRYSQYPFQFPVHGNPSVKCFSLGEAGIPHKWPTAQGELRWEAVERVLRTHIPAINSVLATYLAGDLGWVTSLLWVMVSFGERVLAGLFGVDICELLAGWLIVRGN